MEALFESLTTNTASNRENKNIQLAFGLARANLSTVSEFDNSTQGRLNILAFELFKEGKGSEEALTDEQIFVGLNRYLEAQKLEIS